MLCTVPLYHRYTTHTLLSHSLSSFSNYETHIHTFLSLICLCVTVEDTEWHTHTHTHIRSHAPFFFLFNLQPYIFPVWESQLSEPSLLIGIAFCWLKCREGLVPRNSHPATVSDIEEIPSWSSFRKGVGIPTHRPGSLSPFPNLLVFCFTIQAWHCNSDILNGLDFLMMTCTCPESWRLFGKNRVWPWMYGFFGVEKLEATMPLECLGWLLCCYVGFVFNWMTLLHMLLNWT